MLKKLLIAVSFIQGIIPFSLLGIEDDQKSLKFVQGEKSSPMSFVLANLEAIKESRRLRDHPKEHPFDYPCILAEQPEPWIPVVRHLLRTMQEGDQNAHIQKLHHQIKHDLDGRNISDAWVVDVHFRYLALSSKLSLDDREFLSHLSHYSFLEALLGEDGNGDPIVLDPYKWVLSRNKLGDDFYGGPQAYPSPGLSEEAMQEVFRQLKLHLPNPIVYPSLGKAVFHPEFIITCLLDEIRLIGIPTAGIHNVHGEPANSLGAAFHDLLHAKADERRAALISYIFSAITKYVCDGGYASDFIPQFVPIAVQKYYLIMDALKRTHESMKGDKHALAGLFFLTFEFPAFPESLFKFTNPSQIVDSMLKASMATFESADAWGNPEDMLQTSPLTGKSSLTPDALKEAVIQRVVKDSNFINSLSHTIYKKPDAGGNLTGFVTDEEGREAARKVWLLKNARYTLKETPQFIVTTFETKDGKRITYSIPTLYRKMRNFLSVSGVLKYAGIDLKQPELKGQNGVKDREIAIAFLKDVRTKIQGTMGDFVKKSKEFFEKKHENYREPYAAAFAAQCARLDAQRPRIKSKEPKKDLFEGITF